MNRITVENNQNRRSSVGRSCGGGRFDKNMTGKSRNTGRRVVCHVRSRKFLFYRLWTGLQDERAQTARHNTALVREGPDYKKYCHTLSYSIILTAGYIAIMKWKELGGSEPDHSVVA